MARKLQPISAADLAMTRSTVRQLRRIRDDLKRLGAVRTVEKVRAAIRSAEGAVRHAERRRNANTLSGGRP